MPKNPVSYHLVDAFTSHPFSGNPAGVCLLDEPAPAEWMQQIAREMNLSETAFLLRREVGFGLRWFTPKVEVDLCGHATLASAHVLWETGNLAPDENAVLFTRSGELGASRKGEWIWLDFPSDPPVDTEPPPQIAAALGIDSSRIAAIKRNRFAYLVEVDAERIVRDLKPNMPAIEALDTMSLIVTSRSTTGEHDFVSRFFAPSVGIPEDPVTGSAHCCLGPYWMERLGKNTLTAYQASERGGVVRVEVKGERVLLGGQAVTVMRGEIAA